MFLLTIIIDDDIINFLLLISLLITAFLLYKHLTRREEVYKSVLLTIQREKFLRNFIARLSSVINPEETKKIIVTEVGKLFNANRCVIFDYDPETDCFLNPSLAGEYLSSPEELTLTTTCMLPQAVDDYNRLIGAEGFVVMEDTERTLRAKNLHKGFFAFFIDYFSIKSVIGRLILTYRDEVLGILSLHYRKNVSFTNEDTEFIKTIANQAGIALNQARIYESMVKRIKTEALLRKIMEIIRVSSDVKQTIKLICQQVGKAFNAGRASIIQFTSPDDYTQWEIHEEYKKKDRYKAIKEVYFDKEIGLFWGQKLFDDGGIYLIENIPDADIPELLKTTYRHMGLKTLLGIPIRINGGKWGGLFLSEYDYYRHWTKEELSSLDTVTGQIAITLHQSEIYESVKRTARRERLLREITGTIRKNLDIRLIKRSIVKETCDIFNATRTLIFEFDREKGIFLAPDEHAIYSVPGVKSLTGEVGTDFERYTYYMRALRNREAVIHPNVEAVLSEIDPESAKTLQNLDIKGVMVIPIVYPGEIIGGYAVHFDRPYAFGPEEVELAKSIANQAGIAMHQAGLYGALKRAIERGRLLREITDTIRKTLDTRMIKRAIVRESCNVLNATRVFIMEFDKERGLLLPPDEDSAYSIPGVVPLKEETGEDFEKYTFYISALKNREMIAQPDIDKLLQKGNVFDPATEKTLINLSVKGALVIPIIYLDELIGGYVFHFGEINVFGPEEVELAKSIANQAGIAIHQARLYENVQLTAEREKLLREIITEIKLSRDIEQVFSYLTRKFTGIFEHEQTVFIEFSTLDYEKPYVKYQYSRDETVKSLKNVDFPDDCIEFLKEMRKKTELYIENNIETACPENGSSGSFFREFNIDSYILIPFIRYDGYVRFFGLLGLCSTKKSFWTGEKIDLINEIMKSVTIIVSEIATIQEVEELRNGIMLTISHDLQVPIIAELKVLEFLQSQPADKKLGDFLEIINSLQSANRDLKTLLQKLFDSYFYESGKKVLDLNYYSISDLIYRVKAQLDFIALSKSLTFNVYIPENLPKALIDREEIEKVLFYIMENSLIYTQEGGEITVSCKGEENAVNIVISDNGPGIPARVLSRLFERFAMTEFFERKIGSGLSLFLSKQIVEAHKGKISYRTGAGEGTTFTITLPIKPSQV